MVVVVVSVSCLRQRLFVVEIQVSTMVKTTMGCSGRRICADGSGGVGGGYEICSDGCRYVSNLLGSELHVNDDDDYSSGVRVVDADG
ncbi:hypothetical protein QVD17_30985 [Tagetes erecta]|uniref:Uncharacterized protein n=1 Tax=Tagetes erecta TaxID=13708 RepID=A0AAD8K6M9_TARER|nr:hypothetical protein QVD17_30985 [Tagetes erecta]